MVAVDKQLQELVEFRELKRFLDSVTPYQKKLLEERIRSDFAWDKWCDNCQQKKIYRTNVTSGKKITVIEQNRAHSSLRYIRDSLALTIERGENMEKETDEKTNWIEVLNNWQQHGYMFFYFNLGDWIVVKDGEQFPYTPKENK